MEFWLDTINLKMVEKAREEGLIHGVTTNPSILSQIEGPIEPFLEKLVRLTHGPVAVQVTTTKSLEMVEQAKALIDLSNRIIVKIPATPEGYSAISNLAHIGIPTMATAIFSPMQGICAAKAGAEYLAPYVSRIGERGMQVVSTIQTYLERYGVSAKILAASLASVEQVLECLKIGIGAVTLKDPLFEKCVEAPPETYQHLEIFAKDWEKASSFLLKHESSTVNTL